MRKDEERKEGRNKGKRGMEEKGEIKRSERKGKEGKRILRGKVLWVDWKRI